MCFSYLCKVLSPNSRVSFLNMGSMLFSSFSPYPRPRSFLLAAAAAAAKSLQSCPTLCDPMDCSVPGSPVPRTLQARTLEWVAISFSNA